MPPQPFFVKARLARSDQHTLEPSLLKQSGEQPRWNCSPDIHYNITITAIFGDHFAGDRLADDRFTLKSLYGTRNNSQPANITQLNPPIAQFD